MKRPRLKDADRCDRCDDYATYFGRRRKLCSEHYRLTDHAIGRYIELIQEASEEDDPIQHADHAGDDESPR